MQVSVFTGLPSTCPDPYRGLASLEDEQCEMFEKVTMRHSPHVRIPISLQVGSSHLRIVSVCTISHVLLCVLTRAILGQGTANISVARV